MKHVADGHAIKCHLADDVLETMEPVISLSAPSGDTRPEQLRLT